MRNKPIPDPGSRVKKAPDPDPQHWLKVNDVRFVGHPVSLEPSKGIFFSLDIYFIKGTLSPDF
jgi:hypothetical protein